jgi:hypothetical protein
MTIVKEYFVNQIDMRGIGAPTAKPIETSTTCVLRFDDGKNLSLPKLATLFNAAAKDFPALRPQAISIFDDHIEFSAKPKPGYKKLPTKTIGAQG